MLENRVRETTVTTGLTDFALDGAVSSYRTFGTAFGGSSFYYTAFHLSAAEWEIGIGTVSGATLLRTTILQSSNADAKVSFSAGTKAVINAIPSQLFTATAAATKVPLADSAGHISPNWLKPTIGIDYPYVLTDGASVSVDLDLAAKFTLTIAGNRTLTFDNTDASGNFFTIIIKQDVIGGRTITWPTISWQTNNSLNAAPDAYTVFVFSKLVSGDFLGWRVDNRTQAFVTDTYASSFTVSHDLGGNHKTTLTGDPTITISIPDDGHTMRLVVIQDGGGSRIVTWSGVTWAVATPPTLTSTGGRADLLEFQKIGSTIVGRVVVANFIP